MLEAAAATIRRGGLVAMPTETVYGLAADATDARAVARIFEAKGRPRFDPLIVHVDRIERALHLTGQWPQAAHQLAEAFWPGPLTIILPRGDSIPDLVTAGLPTVAIRMPAHDWALELIRRADRPLAAPSANRFGHVSPTEARHVVGDLGSSVDLVLDAGPTACGIESTIVMPGEAGSVVLLRPGAITTERLEAVLGRKVAFPPAEPRSRGITAPGMLARHYAPRIPMRMVGLDAEVVYRPPGAGEWGLISPARVQHEGFAVAELLSPDGDMAEAAMRLFGTMRKLEEMSLDGLLAVAAPQGGLGGAINDRLRRASTE
ncbi:MAG: threonylcarbamoyl-AMP synthase [Phycisphaeraceae bacterium]|nr:threonylcarbamoyl-AMP synthase [Phycisphaeraceae bacterium]